MDPAELVLTLMQSLKRSLKETFVAVDPNDNLVLGMLLTRTGVTVGLQSLYGMLWSHMWDG